MEWKQATFKIPESWREHVNTKGDEWGCDAASIWIAAVDSFIRDPNAPKLSAMYMLALRRRRPAFEEVVPGEALAIAEQWGKLDALSGTDKSDKTEEPRKTPKRRQRRK